MENKKPGRPVVDEQLMMQMMAGDDPGQSTQFEKEKTENTEADTPEKLVKKEKPRPTKNTDVSYIGTFLKNAQTNARDGKSVYIRPEFHERLSRIVQVIGGDKISIYAYLDNVLEQHFLEYAAQITKSFEEKYKPII